MRPRQGAPHAAPRVCLMGVWVDPLTIDDLNRLIGRVVAAGEKRIIAHHNLRSLYLHDRDESIRSFFRTADYAHIDGMALVGLGQRLGLPLRREHRVTYVDWTPRLMGAAAAQGWRIFYLGSRPGVAARGAEVLRDRHPGLEIVTAHGYLEDGSEDERALLARINEYRPEILMVGMGMPLQERWILRNLDRLDVNVILPCGACIDYVAGAIPTPPRWMGRAGIEWLYRLGSEPRRLWRRYLLEPWALIPRFLREMRGAPARAGRTGGST
jgi:N-acetylglucosaminyldiphosphoundecaprenol N-acetyl-beta-D-mannosaminyltransferase